MKKWFEYDGDKRLDLFKRKKEVLYLLYHTDTVCEKMCVAILLETSNGMEQIFSFPTQSDIDELYNHFRWTRIAGHYYISPEMNMSDLSEYYIDKFCEDYVCKLLWYGILPFNEKLKHIAEKKNKEFTDNMLFWSLFCDVIVTEIKEPVRQIVSAIANKVYKYKCNNKKVKSEKGQIIDSEPIQLRECKGAYSMNPSYEGENCAYDGGNIKINDKGRWYGNLD